MTKFGPHRDGTEQEFGEAVRPKSDNTSRCLHVLDARLFAQAAVSRVHCILHVAVLCFKYNRGPLEILEGLARRFQASPLERTPYAYITSTETDEYWLPSRTYAVWEDRENVIVYVSRQAYTPYAPTTIMHDSKLDSRVR